MTKCHGRNEIIPKTGIQARSQQSQCLHSYKWLNIWFKGSTTLSQLTEKSTIEKTRKRTNIILSKHKRIAGCIKQKIAMVPKV